MKTEGLKISDININEALRYLGYKNGEPDQTTKELLFSCKKELLEEIKPKYVYKVFDLNKTTVMGCDFQLIGKSITQHLKDCSKVIFLCCTLSADVDKLIRKKQITSMTEAVMVDALASVAIEHVLDRVEQLILKDFSGYQHTWRFGIGYGDFPLELQGKFLDVLDAHKRIGLSVNDSQMLTPSKSITCIIGLGKEIDKKVRKTCDICTLADNCQYRKVGHTCE